MYQGEEIGMTNCHLEQDEWRDYEAIQYLRHLADDDASAEIHR